MKVENIKETKKALIDKFSKPERILVRIKRFDEYRKNQLTTAPFAVTPITVPYRWNYENKMKHLYGKVVEIESLDMSDEDGEINIIDEPW